MVKGAMRAAMRPPLATSKASPGFEAVAGGLNLARSWRSNLFNGVAVQKKAVQVRCVDVIPTVSPSASNRKLSR